MTRAALVLVAILAAPARAVPRCDMGPMSPRVAHGQRLKIAGSGGVIVASGDAMPDWRFRIVNTLLRPVVSQLAPGLAIYHPPRPLAGVDVVLEDIAHQVVERTELTLGTIDPVPEPPVVRSIVATGALAQAAVTLSVATLPGTVVAAVISRVDGAKLTPLAWSFVQVTDPASLVVWRTPQTCVPTIAGLVQPRPGMRVVITWVDELGRVSEPSKPIVITGGSKGK